MNTSTPSIAIIAPYFGERPNYFDLWLHSCRMNASIDWKLFVDHPIPYPIPSNVHVTQCSFDDFKAKIQSIFSFDVLLDHPYKLCDYKPAYGEALRDSLAPYDFWGYCDLDVIFGNLRSFLSTDLLASADRIFTGGHLSLFRNTDEVRTTYRRGAELGLLDYRDVYKSAQIFAFDEWGVRNDGLNQIFSRTARFHLSTMPYADVKVRHYALRTNREGFTLDPDVAKRERAKNYICYRYQEGRLHQFSIDSTSHEMVVAEEAYIHLQKRPMERSTSSKRNFMILPPNRIVTHHGDVTMEFLRKNARDWKIYPHYYRMRLTSARKSIRRRAALAQFRRP